MSSLFGALDMENVKMSMDTTEASSSSSTYAASLAAVMSSMSNTDSLANGLDNSASTSYGFTDPALINQLREMENDVKFAVPMNDVLTTAQYSSHASIDPNAQVTAKSMAESLTAPLSFFETSQTLAHGSLGASPANTLSSGHSPPQPLTSSAGPTPAMIDASVVPSSMPSLGSPVSPPPGHPSSFKPGSPDGNSSSKGLPLSGLIPTRHGSQVTVGAVVASVLDNVVQMASQARDAYLAGKNDQTHAQIEEMLESLKLVGGFGVGPSIGNVHSNRPNSEGQDDTVLATSGRAEAERSRIASAPAGISPRMQGSSSGSPHSSVSPPQRFTSNLPLTSFNSADMAHSSSVSNSSPSPPSSLVPGSVATVLGGIPTVAGDGHSDLPMGQAPSGPGFDSSRKRTAATAPTLPDARGPTKFTKLSPPLGDTDVLLSNAPSAPPLASHASTPPHAPAPLTAPPLIHAHTYPVSVAQGQMPVSTLVPAAGSIPSNMFSPVTAQAIPGSLMSDSAGSVAVGSAASAAALGNLSMSSAGILQPVSPNTLHSAIAPSMSSGWPADTSSHGTNGVVIPPPHRSPERRFSSDSLAGFRNQGNFPPTGSAAGLDPSLTRQSPNINPAMQLPPQNILTESVLQQITPPNQSVRHPSLAASVAASSLMMDVDMGYPAASFPAQVHTSPPTIDAFGQIQNPVDVAYPQSRPGTANGRPSPPNQAFGVKQEGNNSSPDGSDDEDNDGGYSDDDDDDGNRGSPSANGGGGKRSAGGERRTTKRRGGPGSGGDNPAHALTPEMKAEVDRIFLEYLNRICSNLDATDSKGENIHQTLMAKKMARLDESPDFRPFKFRIQAFTNGFVEELARQGYGEDQIPIKKTKAYLWHHNPYIARFNEDGKKAKSKGNHIWNIEAKKVPSVASDPQHPRWIFKKFTRKIAGTPPSMAYIGLKWSWEPKIWDPQLSRASIDVEFSSPNLPPWMRWEKGLIIGVPTPDSHSVDLTVEAKFLQEGQEKVLSVSHPITVAPLAVGDASFPKTRRPSLLGPDGAAARRFVSDSVIPQTAPARMAAMPVATLPPPAPTPAETAQVIAVINSAANRVAAEAQTQAGHVLGPAQAHAAASLAKQQQVLAVAAKVISNEAHDALVGRTMGEQPKAASMLVQATQSVVHQAARQVQADKTAVAILQSRQNYGPVPPAAPAPVSLTDVSIATQSAVAHAVAITGSQSSEVEVMLTANSLIQQRSRADSRASGPPSVVPQQSAVPPPTLAQVPTPTNSTQFPPNPAYLR